MAAPTGSLFQTRAIQVQEIINKSLDVMLPTLDPVWEDSIVSNQGVGNSDDIGRDFLIIKTFTGSLTGVIDPGGPTTDFTIYGDPSNTSIGAKVFLQGINKTFPDATQGANSAPWRLAVPMRSMVTNLMLTLGESQAEATDAFIGEVIVPKLEGFAKHISQYLCNYFYLSQNSYYALCTVTGAGSGTGWSLNADPNAANLVGMVDTTTDNYCIDRFMVGMRISFYNTTGATIRTTASGQTIFMVTAVDELTGKFYFRAIDNLTLVGCGIVATDIVVFANSKGSSSTPYAASPYFTGIAGINSWLKYGDTNGSTDNASNCLLGDERAGTNSGYSGNVNVNVHPEMKSMQVNNGSNPMTEQQLRKIMRRWHIAKHKYGQKIDCLIASDGVWLAYEAQKIGRQWYDRTGRVSSMTKEGSDGGTDYGYGGEFLFTIDGQAIHGYTSTYVDKQTIYGIRKGNGNWKRYSPADPKNVKKNERLPAWVPFRFVGGALTGTGSNQIPIFSVSNNRTLVTEGVQLPGFLRMQLVPEQPAGLRITNVAEERVYSS